MDVVSRRGRVRNVELRITEPVAPGQVFVPFNYGLYEDGPPNPPSWPFRMMHGGTTGFRGDDWFFLLVPNLNLLRLGFVF